MPKANSILAIAIPLLKQRFLMNRKSETFETIFSVRINISIKVLSILVMKWNFINIRVARCFTRGLISSSEKEAALYVHVS